MAGYARARTFRHRLNVVARLRRFLLGRPLGECVDAGRDNFLLLRLVAALLVVLGHSFVLTGDLQAAGDPVHLLLPRTHAHLVGVALFFTISGFLITLSFQRKPQLTRFLRARFLRLWPGLAVLFTTLAFNLLGDGLRDSFDPRASH